MSFSLDNFEKLLFEKALKILKKGIPIHLPSLGMSGETLAVFREKFNFSIEWFNETRELGIRQQNGSWSGFIGALIEGHLDIAMNLAFTPDRIDVVSPGFALSKHYTSVVFKSTPTAVPSIWAIFKDWDIQSLADLIFPSSTQRISYGDETPKS